MGLVTGDDATWIASLDEVSQAEIRGAASGYDDSEPSVRRFAQIRELAMSGIKRHRRSSGAARRSPATGGDGQTIRGRGQCRRRGGLYPERQEARIGPRRTAARAGTDRWRPTHASSGQPLALAARTVVGCPLPEPTALDGFAASGAGRQVAVVDAQTLLKVARLAPSPPTKSRKVVPPCWIASSRIARTATTNRWYSASVTCPAERRGSIPAACSDSLA